MNLFAELKRRNVIRMAGLYLVGAWLLVQVAGTVLPMFDVPEWVARAIVIVLALGFVPALVFAWVFELTPAGLKRDDEVPREHSIAPQTARRMDRIIMAVLLLALAYFGFDRSVLAPRRDATLIATTTRALAESQTRDRAVASARSIAVLPFENLSEDKANAYFADGMQDEIITRLAKIGQLKVISRSSTERYRTKYANVAEIARELGVANVVEGSVQKVGTRVRINVQLIAAHSDEHLWAELYDRDLTDIFAVQSEVATNIARTLEATLSGNEKKAISGKPTGTPAAYDAYLRGLDLGSRPGQNPRDQKAAARFFAEAVRLDPKFARAWAELSKINAGLVITRIDVSSAREEASRLAAEIATRLDPNSAETLLANAYYRYQVMRDYEGARVLFERLRAEVPSSSDAAIALARIARRQGRWKASLDLYAEAAKLSPRDAELWMDRAWTYSMLRDHEGTRAMIEGALEISPDDPDVIVNQALHYQTTGNLPAARAVLERVPAEHREMVVPSWISLLTYERRFAEAVRLLEKTLAHPQRTLQNDMGVDWEWLGSFRTRAGDAEGAKQAFVRGKAEAQQLQQLQPRNQFIVLKLAACEAGLGNKQAALRDAARAVSMLPASEDPVFGPVAEQSLARIEMMVGEPDRAIARIERLLVTPYGAFPLTQAELRLDPLWDPLRNHPRFKAIVQGPEPRTIYE